MPVKIREKKAELTRLSEEEKRLGAEIEVQERNRSFRS
jgi:hypothetical protein